MFKIIVNGTFDILHKGHLNLLAHAKSYPNSFVYVLIDSDSRIKDLKGNSRPINNEFDRSYMLSSLRYVDKVDIFYTDNDFIEYIKNYKPDLMVKGSDYKDKPILGSEYCKEIKFYEHTGHSTTRIIQYITNR